MPGTRQDVAPLPELILDLHTSTRTADELVTTALDLASHVPAELIAA